MLKESGINRRLTWSLRASRGTRVSAMMTEIQTAEMVKKTASVASPLRDALLDKQDEQRRQAEQSQRGEKFPGGLSFPE